MGGARVLVQVICALAIINSTLAQIVLYVNYPEPDNQNLVRLTCVRGVFLLMDAEFQRNRVPLTSGPPSHQVTIINQGNGEVMFTFTQAQEGAFRCVHEGQTSSEIELAAAPTENYDGTMRFRYLLFPTPDSSRNIELSCAIRPGQLEERYQVEWVALTPPSFVLLNTHFYDISINSTLSSHHRYQCKVTIEYQTPSNFERTYNGPEIIIEKKVLATIDNEIQNVTITERESGNFTCQFSKRDNDITVFWRVDGSQYDCVTAEEDLGPDSIGCYTTETQSVLLIRNASIGIHPVQCVLQQAISREFAEDDSFKEEFNEQLTSALLTILLLTPPQSVTIHPVNSTAVRISWRGIQHLSTALRYYSYYNATGALLSRYESVLPPGVTETEVILNDAVDGYIHNFTLHYTISPDETTDLTYTFDKKNFQIQFGPVDYCLNWGVKKTVRIEELQSHLTRIIRERCTECYEFNEAYLRRGLFLCHGNPTTVTYRSTIVNPFPAISAARLVCILRGWVSTSPSLALDDVLVRVNANCTTCVGKLGANECASGDTVLPGSGVTARVYKVLNECAIREFGAEICHS